MLGVKALYYCFKHCQLIDVKPQLDAYIASLTSPVDDFWEEHILSGCAYSIERRNETVGFFTLWRGSDGLYITSFYLPPACWGISETVFADILSEFSVTRAYVATCDELFLSLVMGKQTHIGLQAYFFADTPADDVPPPQFGIDNLRRVWGSELAWVNNLTENFFAECTSEGIDAEETILWEIYEGGEPLGFGVVGFNRLATQYASCGEYVLKPHRNRGVARSLQYHMAAYIRARGLIPIGGCWHLNTASRNTFISIGRYSRTRLLKADFAN